MLGATTLMAAPAHAAKVAFGLTAGEGAEDQVVFRAAPGERNRVRVRLDRGKKRMTIVDTGVRRIKVERADFPTCRSGGARRVVCRLANVVVLAGDRDDTVTFAGKSDSVDPSVAGPLQVLELLARREDARANGALPEATDVAGGPGDDVIVGSDGDDIITPGPGRDRIDTGAGDDVVVDTPDGADDSIRAGAGLDGLEFTFAKGRRVKVDLAARTVRAAGERDRVRGFENVSGGPGDDTLLGDDKGNALAGSGGADVIDGRGGNDLVAGGQFLFRSGLDSSSNRLEGGPGDDLVSARTRNRTGASDVGCGAGTDRVLSDVRDRVVGCELAAFEVVDANPSPFEVPGAFRGAQMRIAPVSRAADGAPTFEVPCPATDRFARPVAGCTGTLALEAPPVTRAGGPPERFGTGSFSLARGTIQNVAMALTPAGKAALAAGSPVALHVIASLAIQPGGGSLFPSAQKVDFGWQQQPLGG